MVGVSLGASGSETSPRETTALNNARRRITPKPIPTFVKKDRLRMATVDGSSNATGRDGIRDWVGKPLCVREERALATPVKIDTPIHTGIQKPRVKTESNK